MKLTARLKKAIHNHAADCYPAEACGLIVDGDYIRCTNTAPDGQFAIDSKDWAAAEDSGTIEAIVHSHPDGTTVASDLDRHQIELHGVAWVICAYPDLDFAIYKPCGYQAPLIGRNYYHGWQDCYSIVKDFYAREMGIDLPDFERQDRWWESKDNSSLYLDGYPKAGFVEVSTDDLRYGDVLLCRVGQTEHVNHALIYLADNGMFKSEVTEPCIGNSLILHHPYGRKSVRDIYGQMWMEKVVKAVRYAQNH